MEPKQAELELSVIKTIMEDSRTAVYDSGIQGILWSSLVAAVLMINYVIIITGRGTKYIGLTWLVLMGLGTAVSIYIGQREKKRRRVKTFAGRILTSVWIAIGVSNTIVAIASVLARAYGPLYIIPIDSIVLGIGFHITSVVMQMKIMKFVSYAWWIGGVLFFVFPSIHCLLYFSVMLILSLLIPALENRKRWKAELKTNEPAAKQY